MLSSTKMLTSLSMCGSRAFSHRLHFRSLALATSSAMRTVRNSTPLRSFATKMKWMEAKKQGLYRAPIKGEEGFVERAQKRVPFPTNHITLRLERNATMKRENKFVFIIPPRMSKWELKQILTKVYDVDVLKINVANYDGKIQKWQRQHIYKEKDYKKAIVRLQPRFPGDTFGLPADF